MSLKTLGLCSALFPLLALLFLLPALETNASSDVSEDSKAELRSVEDRFNRAARERDRETFHKILTSDSAFLAGELHQGRLEVMAVWQPLFDGKYDFRYEAQVIDVGVARSRDLGWAIGKVKTRFQRPGMPTAEETDGHYLHVWTKHLEAPWRLAYASTLVVHPTLGAARDPRSGLMTAWPKLADQIGAEIDLRWKPTVDARAHSGELAVTFGDYEASFTPSAQPEESGKAEKDEPASSPLTGKGHFLAVWEKDAQDHWQLIAEGFTPPGIYGAE